METNSHMHSSFTNHLQEVYFMEHDIARTEIDAILQKFRQLESIGIGALMPAFYAIDYTRQEYVLMSEGSKSIVGLHPRAFLDGGLALLFDIYDRNDFKVYNEQIFARNCSFLSAQATDTRQQYIFSYTFRVNIPNHAPLHIYQRGSYLTDSDGLPLYSLGMALNITGMANQQIMYHSIERMQEGVPQVVAQQLFYPCEEDTLLSERERTIALCMAEGLSIKQIAARLFIAANTVANHRKNMMQKTGTKNMAELIAFVARRYMI